MNNQQIIEYRQNGQRFLNVVLPHKVIDAKSEVLVYGKNAGGYQRDPEPNHYNKIKNYILSKNDFILPTSIVLAVDEDDINRILFTNEENTFIDLSNINEGEKIFRIVDGQHRIIAMREAVKVKPELKNFQFDVVILVTNRNMRSIEMEIFYDINSKGKRLKVDLIELARFNYRILEKSFKEREINEHVSIQTAYFLNEEIENSLWNNAIKFGIHDDHVVGIIGVNAFRESISMIVDVFLKEDEKSKFRTLKGEDLVLYTQEAAKKIANFINIAWEKSVKSKWGYCFKEGIIELDLFLDPKKVYYDQKYYLQKTMGSKSINSVLGAAVGMKINNKTLGLTENALKEFDKMIMKSQVTSDDWKIGGEFGGYSSESGFKKVSKYIKNEIKLIRKN